MCIKCFIIVHLFLSSFAIAGTRVQNLERFTKALHLIETKYYRELDLEKLIQGAIEGMIHTLDPHSSFLDKQSFKRVEEDISGEFAGIGIQVFHQKDRMIIVAIMEDSPAFKSGLQVGDKIIGIDDQSTIGMTLKESIKRMRGFKKKKLHLEIMRDGKDRIKSFYLTRETIKIQVVRSEIIFDHYIYLKLKYFQEGVAEKISLALRKHKKLFTNKKKLKGIILDLRSNPGGLFNEAMKVSSLFMKDGVVVSTEKKDLNTREIFHVMDLPFKDFKTPMAVLIDSSSASASEIVAGALQDSKRAVVMGERSFGKGTVQSIIQIDDLKEGIKLTIAQYMTPSGKKIQARGIIPDFAIDRIDNDMLEAHSFQSSILRESDLWHHISASKETDEEKETREEGEKQKRLNKIEKIRRREENADPTEVVRKKEPKNDYQIIQVVKYLKSISLLGKIIR